MKEISVFFCGLSKESGNTLINNINFITNYSDKSDYDINLIVVDSNSEKKIKEYLKNTSNNNPKVTVIHQDKLENQIPSRIQRIAYCRNLCLDFVYKDIKSKDIVYIPCDLDVELFNNSDTSFMDYLINKSQDYKDSAAIFPVSNPRYYDILALRAKGWVTYNSQLINSRFKKYIRFGSFFTNYFFVFRHQWKIEKIESKDIEILSAFGGIGVYSLGKVNKKIFYHFSDKHTEFISEHVAFNKYFKYKEIDTTWIVNAPDEHVHFHKLTILKKIIYLFKTIKYDIYN